MLLEAAGKKGWRLHPAPGKWNLHPAARTFQALRILVNRELANLEHLLRVLPGVLRPGGRAAIISFHSGEDRQVKAAFRAGFADGVYDGDFGRTDPAVLCGAHRQPAVAVGEVALGATGLIGGRREGFWEGDDANWHLV